MKGTARRPAAKKYRFAALRLKMESDPREAGIVGVCAACPTKTLAVPFKAWFPKPMNIRKIKNWRWEIVARYWQVRRGLLEWVFAHLNSVRCRFVAEQRLKEPPEPDAVVRALGNSDSYLGEGSYRRFSLKRGQITLATLVEYTGDFPWIFCHCTPTPAFETVRPEFEEFLKAAHAMGTPEGYQVWRRALRRVRRLGLKLIPLELPRMQGPYPTLLYINGDKARFKMSSAQNVTSWPW